MADDSPLGALIPDDGKEWALEETQKKIEAMVKDYLTKHAKNDTKHLEQIAKNMAKMTGEQYNKILQALQNQEQSSSKENELSQNLIKQIKENAQQQQENSEKLVDELTDAQARRQLLYGGGMGASFRAFDTHLGGAVDGLSKFDGRLSAFTDALKAVPFGFLLGTLGGYIADSIDRFREFNLIGQTFNNDIFGMAKMAGDAGLSVEQFGEVIRKYARTTVAIGAETIAGTQKQIRSLTRDLSHFGFSIESLADFTASYLDQMVVTGQYERLTAAQLRQQTLEYIGNLAHLSRMTGKSAEQLSEEQREMAEHLDAFAVGLSLSGQEQMRYYQGLDTLRQNLAKYPKELQDSFIQLAADNTFWGNYMQNELGQMLARIPSLRENMESVLSAFESGDAQTISLAMDGFNDAIQNLPDDEINALVANLKNANDAGARELITLIQNQQRWNDQRQKEIEARADLLKDEFDTRAQAIAEAKRQITAEETANNQFLQLQSDLANIFGRFRSTLLTRLDPVFNMMGDMMESITRSMDLFLERLDLSNINFEQGFSGFLDSVYEALNKALFGVFEDGAQVGRAKDTIWNYLKGWFGDFFESLSGQSTANAMGTFIAQVISSTFKALGGMIVDNIGTVAGGLIGGIAGIFGGKALMGALSKFIVGRSSSVIGAAIGTVFGPIGTLIGGTIGTAVGMAIPYLIDKVAGFVSDLDPVGWVKGLLGLGGEQPPDAVTTTSPPNMTRNRGANATALPLNQRNLATARVRPIATTGVIPEVNPEALPTVATQGMTPEQIDRLIRAQEEANALSRAQLEASRQTAKNTKDARTPVGDDLTISMP